MIVNPVMSVILTSHVTVDTKKTIIKQNVVVNNKKSVKLGKNKKKPKHLKLSWNYVPQGM